MARKIKFKKKEPLRDRIKKKIARGVIMIFSLLSSIIYVIISLFAGKIQDIVKPYLQSHGYPDFIHSSFTLYATIFIAITYINKNIFKKIADMESDLNDEVIDESVLDEIKKIEDIKAGYESKIASLQACIDVKESMIKALIDERSIIAGMDAYNSMNAKGNSEISSPKRELEKKSFNLKYSIVNKGGY